jgi:hypothetical protein
MLIPKDSTLFVATWAIHHSEDLFSDHDTFNGKDPKCHSAKFKDLECHPF